MLTSISKSILNIQQRDGIAPVMKRAPAVQLWLSEQKSSPLLEEASGV